MSNFVLMDDASKLKGFIEQYKAQGCEIGYQMDKVRAYNPKTYQTVAELMTPLGGVGAMILLKQVVGGGAIDTEGAEGAE